MNNIKFLIFYMEINFIAKANRKNEYVLSMRAELFATFISL